MPQKGFQAWGEVQGRSESKIGLSVSKTSTFYLSLGRLMWTVGDTQCELPSGWQVRSSNCCLMAKDASPGLCLGCQHQWGTPAGQWDSGISHNKLTCIPTQQPPVLVCTCPLLPPSPDAAEIERFKEGPHIYWCMYLWFRQCQNISLPSDRLHTSMAHLSMPCTWLTEAGKQAILLDLHTLIPGWTCTCGVLSHLTLTRQYHSFLHSSSTWIDQPAHCTGTLGERGNAKECRGAGLQCPVLAWKVQFNAITQFEGGN